MAVTADSVVVELEARTGRYNAQIRDAERNFDRSMKGIGGSAIGMERAVGGAFSRVGGLFAGVSAIAGARAYLGLADSFKNLQAQLRLATAESGNFFVAQEDVSRIARETRTGIEETASLYGAFARNAAQLGITQEQAARSTETISKAFQISGATSAEAAGGLRQFLQALQSGVLRGEEFNSVVENAPRLAKLLADQLSGGNVGALRKLAEQGKITAQELTNALTNIKATEAIDAEFRQLPVTFDQSMTLVKNAAIETFGAFDRGGQFSQSLANFFQDGSEGFAGMANDAENAGAQIRVAFETLSDMFEPIISAARSAWETIGLDGRSIAQQIRDDFVGVLRLADSVNEFGARNIGTARTNYAGNFEARSQFESDRTSSLQFGRSLVADLARNNPRNSTSPRAIAASTSDADRKKAAAAAKRAAAEDERARLEAQRNTDRYNDDLSRLERDELRGKAQLTQNAGERAEIEKQLIALDQREYEEGIKRRVRDGELTQQRANRLLLGSRFNAALEGDVIAQEEAARAFRLEADALRDQEETARSAIELTDSRIERLAIERRLLALAEEQERIALEEAIARGEILDAAQARANLETRQGNRRAGTERANASPLERYRSELGAFSANINDEFERVQVDGLQSLEDGLTGVIDGTKSLGDAFKNVSNQIIADLARIAIRKAIIEPLASSLFGGGGGGGLGSILGSIAGAPGRASGGDVMAGKAYMTGERGRELFVPSQSGKIYATGALNAAASQRPGPTIVQQSFVLDARGGVVTQDLLRQVNQLSTSKAAQAGKAAYDASPSRLAKRETLGT